MTIYFIYSNILWSSTMNSYALLLLLLLIYLKIQTNGGEERKCYASIFLFL